MSWIDSENIETCITDASIDQIVSVLEQRKYNIVRTRLQVTATYGGTWSTNGKISTITIIDKGNYRECTDKETAKGYMCSPKTGVLAEIIQEAELLIDE